MNFVDWVISPRALLLAPINRYKDVAYNLDVVVDLKLIGSVEKSTMVIF